MRVVVLSGTSHPSSWYSSSRKRDTLFDMHEPRRTSFPGLEGMRQRRRALIEELVASRHAVGLSQTEVAARMGTSQSAVARLEGGEADTRVSTLERYAAALDRSVDWQLRAPEEPQ